MRRPRLAIATMTYVKEGDTLLMDRMTSALEVLSKLPYQVFVADGGSPQCFTYGLKQMDNLIVSHVDGKLTKQHKHSIGRAAEVADHVLYTEPDKGIFFKEGIEQSIEQYFLNLNPDFAVIGRVPAVMETYAPGRQYWENLINGIMGAEMGIDNFDAIFGPKIFKSELAAELNDLNVEAGWAALMFLVGRAHTLGYDIKSINNANICPDWEQKEVDNIGVDILYRGKQACDNLFGFLRGINQNYQYIANRDSELVRLPEVPNCPEKFQAMKTFGDVLQHYSQKHAYLKKIIDNS